MTAPEASGSRVEPGNNDLIADVFHGMSQPLTALECGLEISLRQDKHAGQFRARMQAALGSAQILHQRMVELRMLLDAEDPGDTTVPVGIDGLLMQLKDDFGPVADAARIVMSMRCKPTLVRGNAARLRNGFFHLFEFLVGSSPPHHAINVFMTRISNGSFNVRFSVRPKTGRSDLQPTQPVNMGDLTIRIARRTFQAAGGELAIKLNARGNVEGHVLLQLANG